MILRQAYFGPKLGGVYLTTHATAYGWQAYVGGRKRQWGWEGFGKHKSREQWPPRPCWEGNGRRGDAIGGGDAAAPRARGRTSIQRIYVYTPRGGGLHGA